MFQSPPQVLVFTLNDPYFRGKIIAEGVGTVPDRPGPVLLYLSPPSHFEPESGILLSQDKRSARSTIRVPGSSPFKDLFFGYVV